MVGQDSSPAASAGPRWTSNALDLIDRFYEAFSRRDVDAVLELCHEDVEIYKDPDVVEMVSALTPRGQERVAHVPARLARLVGHVSARG